MPLRGLGESQVSIRSVGARTRASPTLRRTCASRPDGARASFDRPRAPVGRPSRTKSQAALMKRSTALRACRHPVSGRRRRRSLSGVAVRGDDRPARPERSTRAFRLPRRRIPRSVELVPLGAGRPARGLYHAGLALILRRLEAHGPVALLPFAVPSDATARPRSPWTVAQVATAPELLGRRIRNSAW